MSNTPAQTLVPDPVSRLLRDLIHERLGLFFDEDRLEAMMDKLVGRVAARGCRSLLDYYYVLKYDDSQGPEEWRRVMDALSVQETYFWREIDQIEVLVRTVVPEWFRRETEPLRIWSAACATGEEPFTIAIALREAGLLDGRVELLASDASEAALAKAAAGVYRERSFRALPPHLREKYFRAEDGRYRLDPEIRNRVRFRRANLALPFETADLAQSPVVFCRNVFIYFSPQSVGRVVASFASVMPDNGYLFIGASESLVAITREFELQELGGAFVYKRRSTPPPPRP